MFFSDSSDLSLRVGFAVVAIGIVGIVSLLVAAYRLRESTLIAPAAWGVAALGLLTFSCFVATTMYLMPHHSSYGHAADLSFWSYFRYSAAALCMAPTLAQLGAKRPQNGAWQFIVVTLVVVLLLPVVQGWAYGDESPHVHGLFRWLLAAHVFLGVGNYLFTRYAVSAVLLGVGQGALIAEFLPFASQTASQGRERFGLLSLTAAVVAAFVTARLRPAKPLGLDRLWSDFRDAFGGVWALRIAERLNASAQLHRWPVEFSWCGITAAGADADAAKLGDLSTLDPALQHRIEREMRSYLRRFVSHDWIARRLPSGGGSSPAQRLTTESEP